MFSFQGAEWSEWKKSDLRVQFYPAAPGSLTLSWSLSQLLFSRPGPNYFLIVLDSITFLQNCAFNRLALTNGITWIRLVFRYSFCSVLFCYLMYQNDFVLRAVKMLRFQLQFWALKFGSSEKPVIQNVRYGFNGHIF